MIGFRGIGTVLTSYRPIDKTVSPQLDTLRGLSALIVVLGHTNQIFITPLYRGLYPIAGLIAQGAVMMFFVLSGFLITKSITRNFSRNGQFDVAAYAMDRFDRIYPPLIFSVVLVLMLWAASFVAFPTRNPSFAFSEQFTGRADFAISWLGLGGTLTFLNGFFTPAIGPNDPLWSLPYEVWYYVVAGIIAWRPRSGAFIAAAVGLLLGWHLKAFAAYAPVWFAGALIALLHNWEVRLSRALTVPTLAATFCGALALGAVYTARFPHYRSVADVNVLLVIGSNVLVGLSFALVLHMILNGSVIVSGKPARTAAFSYTLYVTHFPILLFTYGTTQLLVRQSLILSGAAGIGAALLALALAITVAPRVETLRPLNKIGAAIRKNYRPQMAK